MCGSLQSACVLWIWRKKLSFLKVSYGWYTATVKGFFALLKISQTILGCRTFPGCPLSPIVFIISMDKISSVHEKRQKGKKVSGSVVSGSCFCCCWCGSLGFSKPWTLKFALDSLPWSLRWTVYSSTWMRISTPESWVKAFSHSGSRTCYCPKQRNFKYQ